MGFFLLWLGQLADRFAFRVWCAWGGSLGASVRADVRVRLAGSGRVCLAGSGRVCLAGRCACALGWQMCVCAWLAEGVITLSAQFSEEP